MGDSEWIHSEPREVLVTPVCQWKIRELAIGHQEAFSLVLEMAEVLWNFLEQNQSMGPNFR